MGAIALAFLLGHCLVHSLSRLPSWGWAPALLASAIALTCVGARGRRLFCWLAAVLCGVMWAWAHAAIRLADDLPAALEGQDLSVRGFVASLPDSYPDPQFLFDVIEGVAGVPSRVRLTWYRAEAVPRPGEQWQLTVRLKRRNGFANPGGFDYEGHLFREGIGATGYVRADDGNRRVRVASMRYAVTRIRGWIAARIAAAAGVEPMLGVLQGLAIGDTQAMQAEQWRVFAATGTTHLMAISGLHIGMLAMAAAWCGGGVRRWRRSQALGVTAMHGQVICGLLAAIVYSVLAGLSIPTQRTLIMLCIAFVVRWRRRALSFSQSFALALIAILIVDPFAPLAVGAWLSFVAVAVIVMAASGRLGREGTIASFTRVQLAVTIGLVPLLLASFGNLSLVSPIANALAVPLFTLLIVPSVLASALGAAIDPALGALLIKVPVTLLHVSWPLFQWLADQSLSVWHVPSPGWPALVALSCGVLLLVLPGIWPLRLAGLMLCLPAFFARAPVPSPGTFELTALDVGQGLAVVIRTHSRILVYDTGPAFQSGRSAAELAVLPFLRHLGVREIDLLMVSHGDQDHSGGLRAMLDGLPIRRLVVGPDVPSVADSSPDSSQCVRGQSWQWDDVTFTVLHPAASAENGNDASCVLLIRGVAGSALLTGDIESSAERELLRLGVPRVQVMVAPHHGSDTSSTPLFVAETRPDVTIFSTGYRNRWNFPRPAVVERWLRAGGTVHDTSASGAITTVFGDAVGENSVQVREQRHIQRRYWNR